MANEGHFEGLTKEIPAMIRDRKRMLHDLYRGTKERAQEVAATLSQNRKQLETARQGLQRMFKEDRGKREEYLKNLGSQTRALRARIGDFLGGVEKDCEQRAASFISMVEAAKAARGGRSAGNGHGPAAEPQQPKRRKVGRRR